MGSAAKRAALAKRKAAALLLEELLEHGPVVEAVVAAAHASLGILPLAS